MSKKEKVIRTHCSQCGNEMPPIDERKYIYVCSKPCAVLKCGDGGRLRRLRNSAPVKPADTPINRALTMAWRAA